MVDGENHSEDIVKVWHGTARPAIACGFHAQDFRELVYAAHHEILSNAQAYTTRAARDAAETRYGDKGYWDYLEQSAMEYAERFPEQADYFLTRNLGEALRGNDGE